MKPLIVRQVMEPNPVTVQPDCTVQDALQIMNASRIGSVLVTDPPSRLIGIFTERDLIRRLPTAEANWRDYPITAWMTYQPHTIEPTASWDEAASMMERLRIRHLPVIEHGQVIGLLTTRLLMMRRADYLNRYIETRTAELRQAYDQLLSRDAEMSHYLRAAGKLQTRLLLPHAPPQWPEVDVSVHYAPLDHLGGDYYDFAMPDENHLGIFIADASGHSLPAAILAIMTRFLFAEISIKTSQPGGVLTELNRRLQDVSDERFVTAFYGVLERGTGVFRYATAGHPPPLWYQSKTQSVKSVSSSGFILGIMPEEVYAEREIQLELGDKLCFYTDGLIEARNEIGELFGTHRLQQCLQNQCDASAADLLTCIIRHQREFSSNVLLNDDLTLVVMDLHG